MAEHRHDPLTAAAMGRDSDGSAATPTDAGLHRIAIRPNGAAEALALLRAFVDREGCGIVPALAIIVEELVLNLAEHGGARTAALGFARTPGGVALTLIDDGAPFDPGIAPVAGRLPPERGGGAGLALVRAWSRDLRYRSDARGNRLDLLVPYEQT